LSRHFLLVTIGSHGDVHPFVGIGAALMRRGHRATLVTNGHFGPMARKAGLEFIEVGTSEEYLRLARNPELWSIKGGFKVVFGSVANLLPRVYDAIVPHIDSETTVIGSSLALSARVAQEKLGFPLATVHLSPGIFRSSIAPPKLPGLWMPDWLPVSVKRAMWAAGDKLAIDPVIAPPLNAFRAKHGLLPVKRILNDWWNSPDCVIGMFPGWFAPRQPDWPKQTVLTGFPLFDERGHAALPAELETFLNQRPDDPPIAFTPGSAMFFGHEFFEAAAEACRMIGRRGILLTRHSEQVPTTLPPDVIHVPYAPFSELLPRAAALVHHGGIGTTAQGLAAGVPQLIMAMSHDQFDNAMRVKNLDAGDTIKRRAFRAARVAEKLKRLLEDPLVKQRCRDVAARFQGVDALAQTCEVLERLSAPTAPSRTTGFQPVAAAGSG
jgi:UDP:flavonoid glycosyltransferase YjiC (YdhE family)